MMLAVASFAWLGLAGLIPGKSARWYNIMTEKKKHPEWFREDLSRLLAMLQEKSISPVVAERLPLARSGPRARVARAGFRQRKDRPDVPGIILLKSASMIRFLLSF